jgi:hypothetical protein
MRVRLLLLLRACMRVKEKGARAQRVQPLRDATHAHEMDRGRTVALALALAPSKRKRGERPGDRQLLVLLRATVLVLHLGPCTRAPIR